MSSQHKILSYGWRMPYDPIRSGRIGLFVPCIDNFHSFLQLSWKHWLTEIRVSSQNNIFWTLKTPEILAHLRRGDTFEGVHTIALAATCFPLKTADERGGRVGGAENKPDTFPKGFQIGDQGVLNSPPRWPRSGVKFVSWGSESCPPRGMISLKKETLRGEWWEDKAGFMWTHGG